MSLPAFTFTYPIQPRWRDFDALGHVNNATFLTYLEAARLAYQRHVLGVSTNDMPWVLAEARCRYVSPIVMDEPIVVSLRVQRLGTSSLTFAYAVHAGQESRLAAEGEAVQVHVNPATGRPQPIPDEWREQIRLYEAPTPIPAASANHPDIER